jgi:hypothetical protein
MTVENSKRPKIVWGMMTMTNKMYLLVLVIFCTFLITCGSAPQNNPKKSSLPQSQASKGSYYEGDGGKGISIAILAPKATGLSKEQEYIPSLIQGEFVSNFTGYSAISVLDRQRVDEQYAELLSGYYDDNSQAGADLGHLNPTGYLMTGTITKTATGYAMQISITNNIDKMTAASYSSTFTFAELDNLSGVRQASFDLLQKMGVIPTELAKAEFARAATDNHVNAQTSLAQGIVAQRGGTVVEAMGYFYNAVSFDPKLSEANGRLSTLSSNISSGNIGENVRNDIQRRNEWLKILAECENFFSNHLPYEIVYDPHLTQQGTADYVNETVNLSFRMTVKTTSSFQVVQNILDGLNSTGKINEWGLSNWPLSSQSFCDASVIYNPFKGKIYWKGKYPFNINGNLEENWGMSSLTLAKPGRGIMVNVALVNDYGKTIANTSRLFFQWIALLPDRKKGTIIEGDIEKLMKRNWDAEMNMEGTGSISVTKQYINRMNQPIIFSGVNANDITDNLTIKIIGVNGIDAETAGKTGYIRITTGNIKE